MPFQKLIGKEIASELEGDPTKGNGDIWKTPWEKERAVMLTQAPPTCPRGCGFNASGLFYCPISALWEVSPQSPHRLTALLFMGPSWVLRTQSPVTHMWGRKCGPKGDTKRCSSCPLPVTVAAVAALYLLQWLGTGSLRGLGAIPWVEKYLNSKSLRSDRRSRTETWPLTFHG